MLDDKFKVVKREVFYMEGDLDISEHTVLEIQELLVLDLYYHLSRRKQDLCALFSFCAILQFGDQYVY